MISTGNVSAGNAIKTPQFWLLWVVLCFNVTAGIGILERAAPIYRDFFPDAASPAALAAAAAGFVAMLSLANALGRIIWSSTSDWAGRKNMYRLYLGVGALLYLAVTLTTNSNKVVFLVCCDPHPVVLRCRVRHRPGLPAGSVRHLPGRRHPRAAAHRLVRRRGARAADRQRHRRRPDRGRRAGPGSLHHGVHDHDRSAGRRVRLQRADPAGQRAVPRARTGRAARTDGSGDQATDGASDGAKTEARGRRESDE